MKLWFKHWLNEVSTKVMLYNCACVVVAWIIIIAVMYVIGYVY